MLEPVRVVAIHHVQVCGPPGCEEAMRAFYGGVLGMTEIEKPVALRARGGAWFRAGAAEVHVSTDEGFVPARKAHPAFVVSDVGDVAARVVAAGGRVAWDESIDGTERFHTRDPVGNRVEFQRDRTT